MLEGLERNGINQLYVFADGPKTEDDLPAIEHTRQIVRSSDFCAIELITREENLGLEASFLAAYEHLFQRHDRAIVFEDDCVPSGDCIWFMRRCLDEYEDDERVMNVHGYGPPINLPDGYEHDVYFTWRSGSWGQATWRTAWEKLERDPGLLDQIADDAEFRRKVKRAGRDLIPMLRQEVNDEIDSIQVWWSLTLVRNDGMSVNPVKSRVKNIGLDGTGVHSGTSSHFTVDIEHDAEQRVLDFPPTPHVNQKINQRYTRFISEGLRGRIRRWIKGRYRQFSR